MTNTVATTRYRAARDSLFQAGSDYHQALSSFSWPDVGETFNWAIDWFDAIGRGQERTALLIVEEDGSQRSYSYDDMVHRSDALGHWLAAQGVAKGDPVILMLTNQVELWDCMLACMKLGAIIMPTTTAVGPTDLVDRVERGGVRHVITNASDTGKFATVEGSYTRFSVGAADGWLDLREAYQNVADAQPHDHPGTRPDDPLLYYFTSGTTSRPKLVEHTQSSYPIGHLSTAYWLGIRPGDVHLNISSPGWAKHAWSCFFAPWIAEATIFIYNYTRFSPSALLEQLRTHQVTTFCAPPTVWRMLINADLGDGKGSLRELIGAGEPLNPEVISKVQQAWGLTIRDGYGQTEMTAAIGNTPGQPLKAGSMGRPLPGMPVAIVDPMTGERVQAPGEGEICLDLSERPVSLMTGYLGDEAKTASAMEGGFYHTGDVATVDEDGYITYVGRTDDVFKASDYKISPFELESVLIEHPAVAEAAIVPAPDPVRLAVPKAYLTLVAGHEPGPELAESIFVFAREKLAPWQRVRRLEFAELPKTISGKIRRVELRGRENAHAEAQTRPDGEFRDEDFKKS